jgi:hypothetical protein
VRRVALLTTTFVLLMAAGGCRHDGRTLRPARSDQTGTVSTTPATTSPALVDPDAADSTAAALSTNAVSTTAGNAASTSVAAGATLPPTDSGLIATAPWRDGGAIDARYTCDGVNVAPALSWSAAPAGTVEIAITLTDLDAPDFAHWAIAALDPGTIALNEDTVPLGAYEATNGAGDIGYTGPCPPAGSEHEYRLTVHYLGSATGLDDGVSAADLLVEIEARETASADVTGTYARG